MVAKKLTIDSSIVNEVKGQGKRAASGPLGVAVALPVRRSNRNPLDLIERHLITRGNVEPGSAGGLVARHLLGGLQFAAVSHGAGNAG